MAYWVGLFFAAVTVAGCLYTLLAAALVIRFGSQVEAGPLSDYPSVTILKPLHGAEPALRENLLSFCMQNYPGPVQVIFGVQDPTDAAIGVVQGIIDRLPGRDLSLVVCGQRHGSNPKISNLINMAPRARGEVIVLADSDMRAGSDYLAGLVPLLLRDGIGAVTCAYHGQAGRGLWSRVGDLGIDSHFLPGAIVGLALGVGDPCFGSTIALRRETLERIGGLHRFRDTLADDHAIGQGVRELGQRIAVTTFLLTHTGSDTGFRTLFQHELRWSRTVWIVNPGGFAGTGITHVFPLSLITLALLGLTAAALGLVAAALLCRVALLFFVARRFRLENVPFRLLPLRDILSFTIYVACFISRNVQWRGQRYAVAANGTMELQKESR